MRPYADGGARRRGSPLATSRLEDGVREPLLLRMESDGIRDHPMQIRARDFRGGRHSPRDGAPPASPSSEPSKMVSFSAVS
jgi:hypothetical protein